MSDTPARATRIVAAWLLLCGRALAVPATVQPPGPLPGNSAGTYVAGNDPRIRLNAPQLGSYDAFGDSITAGCCTAVPGNIYVTRLATMLGVTATNHGVSGSVTQDQIPAIYAITASDTASQLFSFQIGTNEATFSGTAANRQLSFQSQHQAALAWLAIPARDKMVGQTPTATIAISSITAVAATGGASLAAIATATTASAHGYATGQGITIAGATQGAYNVTTPITVTGPTTFTFPLSSLPTSPATTASSFSATTQGIAYTGAWTNDTADYAGTMSRTTTTSGSTATFKAFGPTVYLAYGLSAGDGGVFTVTVDGVLYGTYTSSGLSGGFFTSPVVGVNHGSGLARLSGLSNQTHTVTITVTSATAAGNDVWLDWVASPGATYFAGPTVLANGTPRQGPGVDTAQLYASLVRQDVGTLADDGLNVIYADVPSNINPATDINQDGTHPNDTGHLHIAEAMYSALNTASSGRGKSGVDAAKQLPVTSSILSGAGYGNLLTGVGPGGNNILGGGYGGANSMTGSGNNNAVVAGSTNSVGGGGTNNTNNNVVAGGSQNVIQFGGNNFLGSGALNAVQGFYNFLGAGESNQVFGANSGIVAGTYGTDRSRYGWIGAGVGSFTATGGTAQYGKQGLRGSGTTAAAFRGTADGAAAGSANTVNIPAGAHYHTLVSATCRDTTVSGWASWDASGGDLDRATGGVASYSGGYSSATAPTRSGGTLTGVTVALSADTTNNGLVVSWTPAAGNTDTLHCLATVDTAQEVQ